MVDYNDNGKKSHHVFNSVTDFADTVKSDRFREGAMPFEERITQDEHKGTRGRERKSFWGGMSWEEAYNACFTGWSEGEAKLDQFVVEVGNNVSEITREIENFVPTVGVVGLPIVPHVVMGIPEWAQAMRREPVEEPVVSIVMNGGYNSATQADTVFARGAILIQLVDMLEKLGRRVEVRLVQGVSSSVKRNSKALGIITEIVAKQPDQPLNRKLLAHTTCNIAFHRRLHLTHFENHGPKRRKELGIKDGHGYGVPSGIPKEVLNEGDIVIDNAPQWQSPTVQRRELKKMLREAGIEIEVEV